MDVFSHAAWGYATARILRTKPAWAGLLAGAGPDLAFFLPSRVEQFIEKGWPGLMIGSEPGIWRSGGPPLPPELIEAYHRYYVFTHSLVILGAALAILWLLGWSRWAWLGIPWGLHILMDFPTHERYLTPILYPLSDWTIRFVSWSDPAIFIPNLLALGAVYWWILSRPGSPEEIGSTGSGNPEHTTEGTR